MKLNSKVIDGPIPGENYTSDTKNYPWHRPPEFTDINEALDHVAAHMTKSKNAMGMLTMAKAGVPLTTLVSVYLISGIGKGKWTPDYALMIAGPVCKMFEILAKGAGVKYTLGLDDEEMPLTFEFFKGLQEVSKEAAERGKVNLREAMPGIEEEATQGGFMAEPEGTGPEGKAKELEQKTEGFM